MTTTVNDAPDFEFQVDKNELLQEMSTAEGVVARKGTVPVLSHFLFQALDNGLMITATDLDLSVRTICTAHVKKPGACTVPARRLYEYIRLLPNGSSITMKSLPKDWVQIRSGRSHTKLAGRPRIQFPLLPLFPAQSAVSLPKDVLRTMIARTIFAISSDEASRYILNGALLILEPGCMKMVTTDGQRLAHIEVKTDIQVASETRVLIPRNALAEIYALLNAPGVDIVQFARDDSHLFFRLGTRLLTTRQLQGVFPSFEKIMPSVLPNSMLLCCRELSAAIKRVSQFSEINKAVYLHAAKESLRLTSSNSETGESEETLPITFAGDPTTIGFNGGYLLDFLKVVGAERIKFSFQGVHAAAELTPEVQASGSTYRYVVMPRVTGSGAVQSNSKV